MKPYVQTYSVCVGGNDCNAHCPYCVAKMTNPMKKLPLNMRNVIKGANLAKMFGASTALLTGKGEPTLHMSEVLEVAGEMSRIFPLVEIQTNGMLLNDDNLENMYRTGITTICLSAVHWEQEKNREIFGQDYQSIAKIKRMCEENSLSLRLTVMLIDGYVDCAEKIDHLIDCCRDMKVEQLTIRGLGVSEATGNLPIIGWINQHRVAIDYYEYIKKQGKMLNSLVHGAEIYDIKGQNVCVSNCLTMNEKSNDIRQLIYCSDGHIRYDWQYNGAIIF